MQVWYKVVLLPVTLIELNFTKTHSDKILISLISNAELVIFKIDFFSGMMHISRISSYFGLLAYFS